MTEQTQTTPQSQSPEPDLWRTQVETLASMCVGYAPSVGNHDPTLCRMLTLAGLRLCWLLDKLDGYPPRPPT